MFLAAERIKAVTCSMPSFGRTMGFHSIGAVFFKHFHSLAWPYDYRYFRFPAPFNLYYSKFKSGYGNPALAAKISKLSDLNLVKLGSAILSIHSERLYKEGAG